MIALAKHPCSTVRFAVPANFTSSGLMEDPEARAAVELLASDPIPGVAGVARNNLRWFDDGRQRWDEFKKKRDAHK